MLILRRALFCAAALGCHEPAETIAQPPLTVTPMRVDSQTPVATAAAPPNPPDFRDRAPPITAQVVHLSSTPFKIEHVACEERIVAVAKGHAQVAGETLADGDLLIAQGKGSYELTGDGIAVMAIARGTNCEPPIPPMTKKVVRASDAPELSWAFGHMHAHLDAEAKISPLVYVGRLSGDGPVAEHAHAGTWEVLAAIEGSGTFRLDGQDYAMHDEEVVVVPPDTKHSYTPGHGDHLRAVQFYWPPGPEQRFRALADAGAPTPPAAQLGPAPTSFTLKRIDGQGSFTLSAQKGKVVLIDFWATWCEPCKKAIPKLQELYAKYQAQGLVVVGVSMNDASETNEAKSLLGTLGAKYPNLIDGKAAFGSFNLTAMPTTELLDRTGAIRYTHAGYHSGDELTIEQEIKTLLAP